jgi:tetratricopeptide (TPR) repeat protein
LEHNYAGHCLPLLGRYGAGRDRGNNCTSSSDGIAPTTAPAARRRIRWKNLTGRFPPLENNRAGVEETIAEFTRLRSEPAVALCIGNFMRPMKSREAIISQKPEVALIGWANALRLEKKFDLAEAKIREAIDINASSPDAWTTWGLILSEDTRSGKQRFAMAINKFTKACEINPRHEWSQRSLANALRLRTNPRREIKTPTQSIEQVELSIRLLSSMIFTTATLLR